IFTSATIMPFCWKRRGDVHLPITTSMLDTFSIIDNLLCAHCGYDLRTLPADSNCPECGRAIIDSVKMGPLMRWLPGFRSGVSFLCLAFIVGMPQIQDWVYEQAWDRFHLNAEGASAVFFATMFLPAAWFLTTP